jgi:hypothetical protein
MRERERERESESMNLVRQYVGQWNNFAEGFQRHCTPLPWIPKSSSFAHAILSIPPLTHPPQHADKYSMHMKRKRNIYM